MVEKVNILTSGEPGCLVWLCTESGDLSPKEAFLYKEKTISHPHWAHSLWSIDITPSKSLVEWRLMHGKLPTDKNLKLKGCLIPSIYNLCLQREETSFHLFFDNSFSINI